MGLGETLQDIGKLLAPASAPAASESQETWYQKIIKLVSGNQQADLLKKAKETAESSKQERSSLLAETIRGTAMRELPPWATIAFDAATFFGVVPKEIMGVKIPERKETYRGQYIVENVLTFLRFVPDYFKKSVTDLISKTTIFKSIIQNYPGLDGFVVTNIVGGSLRQRALAEDPTAVIDAIRLIHQDLITGVRSSQEIIDMISGFGKTAQVIHGLTG